MNDVPHQWILDKLTALCLMGEISKAEVKRIHALFVQRFPDEVGQMNRAIERLIFDKKHTPDCWRNVAIRELGIGGSLASCTCSADLEQQGDNYITEGANEG